jgi:hypothetical protein
MSPIRRWVLLSLLLLALCSARQLDPAVGAQGIGLELVSRVTTESPAVALAVSSSGQRVFVAIGEDVQEFVEIAPGVVVPALGGITHVDSGLTGVQSAGPDLYVAAVAGVYRLDAQQHRVTASRSGFTAHGLQALGDSVYVAIEDAVHNECGLYVLDRSLNSVGLLVDECRTSVIDGFDIAVADVAAGGSYAYLAGRRSGGFAGVLEGFLATLDVSLPSQAQFAAQCRLNGFPQAVEAVGDYAYVAVGLEDWNRPWTTNQHGLSIVDISNSAAPRVVGHVDTDSKLTSVAVSLPFAFATDTRGRVWAVNVSNPANPTLAAYYDTGFPAHDLAVHGPHIYVADGEGGLVSLRIATVAQPTPIPLVTSAEGTLVRVEASICQAGETHYLPESDLYLYSDAVQLDAYVGQYVRVWGWSVPSPECRLMNVTTIEVLIEQTPTPTATLEPTPTPTGARIHLPIITKH